MQADRSAPLAERVYQAISADAPTGYSTPYDVMNRGHEDLTQFELDVRDWGFAYGVAYALARLDADPFEPLSVTAEAALEPAWAATARFGSAGVKRGQDGS